MSLQEWQKTILSSEVEDMFIERSLIGIGGEFDMVPEFSTRTAPRTTGTRPSITINALQEEPALHNSSEEKLSHLDLDSLSVTEDPLESQV